MAALALALALALIPTLAYADDLRTERRMSTDGEWALNLAFGASRTRTGAGVGGARESGELGPDALISIRYGLSDRLVLSVVSPALAYIAGRPGETELIPWVGVTSWGLGYSSVSGWLYSADVGGGVDARKWFGPDTAINLGVSATTRFSGSERVPVCATGPCDLWNDDGTTWIARGSLGVTERFGDRVTFNLGFGAAQTFPLADDRRDTRVSFGSVQTIGLRALPLLSAKVATGWHLDGYAGVSRALAQDRWEEHYLLGFSHIW